MQFIDSPFELTADNLKPHKTLRALYKGMMNSIIGKFAQRQDYPTTKYISQAEEIDKIFAEGKEEISNFQTIGGDICELQISPLSPSNSPNRKSNPIITAFVTSLSRIDMHENILLLKKKQFKPVYTDTDSLIFIGQKGNSIPFQINGGLGFFKPEFESKLNGFCCIGKKSYAITCENAAKAEIKICGLSFESKQSQDAVTFLDLKKFLDQNMPSGKVVPQSRINCKSLPFSVQKVIKDVKIPCALNFNRKIQKEEDSIYTLPYGYMKK